MRTVYINGKYTAQPLTGVQRVAGCLVHAIDDLLMESGSDAATRWVLLCPPTGPKPALGRIEACSVGPRWAALTLWEQAFLPLASRGSLLLCLAGSAPAAKREQVCVIHDAAVFDTPAAYRWTFRNWYRWLFRRLARSAALIVTVSRHSRLRLAQALSLDEAAIAVVPNGADHLNSCTADASIIARLQLQAGRYFLAVGSHNANKNQAAIVRAFAQMVADDGLRLVLVGDGNPAVFAPDGGLSHVDHRIVRAGRVSDRELKALYAAALALLFPSHTEGFGLPPLEAMACGCPVITSKRGAIPEVCGDAAIYVDADDSAQMAEAMRQLLADPALREHRRDIGLQRARGFTWQAAAQALLSRMARAGLVDAGR